MTKIANIELGDGVEDVSLTGPPVDLFIGHYRIRLVNFIDGPEGVGFKAMDAVGEGLSIVY